MVRPWSPKQPAGAFDVIVIGAGVGGLSAAVLLAHLGRRVLVLEQHTVPGGLSQSFRRASWQWDVGVHLIGEMGPRGLAGRLLKALTRDRLQWTRIERAYDIAALPSGRTIEYRAPLGAQRAHLQSLFPHDHWAIAEWFSLMHTAASAMRGHFIARALSDAPRHLALARTAHVLDGITRDPELRAALTLHWLFYGTPPARSAFGVHALLARHYKDGAYYPAGGAGSLSRALAAELHSLGGAVRTQASVDQLLVQHGHTRGVRLSTGEELVARNVVSAAGALNTLALLPDDERKSDWVQPIEALEPSSAHVCLHLGFEGDLRAAGATESNVFLVNELEPKLWDTLTEKPPVAYVAFPSLKDQEDHSDGRHTAEVVAFCEWAPFAKHAGTRWRSRGDEYDALKARLSAQLLDALLARFPKLKPLIRYQELSTPLSTAHFVRARNGSAYGLDSTPERYACRWLKPRTPVRGLHLAGSDVATIGVTGALAGGVAAALSLEPEAAGAWMRRAVRLERKVEPAC